MGGKKWRDKQKHLGLCIYCTNKAIKGRTYCIEHFEKNSEKSRKSTQRIGVAECNKKRRELYKKRVEDGICTKCGLVLEREYEPYTKCINCLELSHR